MKIRTQFIVTLLLFSVIIVISSASVFFTETQVETINRQRGIAADIQGRARDLSYLSNDYLLNRQSQQRARWESVLASLSGELARVKANTPEQQALVNSMKTNIQRLKAVFTEVAAALEDSSRTRDAADDLAIIRVSWSRMEVQNQGIIFDAVRLEQMFDEQGQRLQQLNIILVVVLVGVFGAYFLINYLLVYRRILNSIADLQAGTKIIGSGNLDFAIEETRKDEIGELSHALNTMTLNLKSVTASKAQLEREVAERKRAEMHLKESEANYRRMVETAGEGIWISDPGGKTLFVNQRMLEIIGYSREEIGERPPLDFMPQTQRASVLDFRARLKQGVSVHSEREFRHKDGRAVHTLMSVTPQFDASGKHLSNLAMYSDITERKKAEAALHRRTHELEVANKELEAFSYSVSHDLRAPLRSMEGFSDIVLEDYGAKLDAQGKEYLRHIQSSSQLMARLIDDILKLGRISRAEMDFERVDLSELARTVAEEIRSTQPGRQAEFVIAPGMTAYGDLPLLKILLQNLLENAWKYTGKSELARIEVGVMPQNGEDVFFIKDNGVGFDMTYAGKLFHPFQRLHSEMEFSGTGIGLAIVQRIVRRHGGRAWGEGEAGKGATFYFTIGEGNAFGE